MRDVLVLTTGGTIEKVHDWRSEGLGFGQEDGEQVVDLLADGRCHHAALLPLMMKDSLDFDDADRQQILDAVLASTQGAIVITHGTGTLGQTAAYLDGRVGARTVVLTGAMRPHSLGRSDASFNMGGAIISAQLLPVGVYGVMNGRVFAAGHIIKNLALGRFDVPPSL
jgi:L-asparaginase